MRPLPGLTIEQQPVRVIARMCLVAEARGERDAERDLDGVCMLAIRWVIENRINQSAGDRLRDARDVILQPKQFSSFNLNDVNRAHLLTFWREDPVSWERADAICDAFEAGLTKDPTLGSLNYYNPRIATPSWGRGHAGWDQRYARGNHVFGIANARPQ